MSWPGVLFWLLATVAVGSALLVVTTRHLVHAALWLVVTLGAVAGVYLLLAAEFVAWVQVLIYVGAVVVLLLFALMLTRAPTGPQSDLTVARVLPAALVAALVGALLVVTVVAGFSDVRIDLDEAVVGSAEVTGETIFRRWVLPFEVLSVLLLAALVGAIVLSRLRGSDEGLDRLDHRDDGLDHRGDGLDHRGDGLDHRDDGLDQRGDGLDHRSDGHDRRGEALDHRGDGGR